MITNKTQTDSNWFTKFFLSFLVIVGGVNSLLFVALPLLPYKLKPYTESAGLFTLAIALLFSFGFSFYWHHKEKSRTFYSEKYTAWLTTLLRYWMAFLISLFGFEKIFEVNFAFTYHVDDSLAGTLTGQELTWKYFGYSYSFSFIISIFQITGSILLLFRRTTLLGVVTLLPVILNIVFINLFYVIGPIVCATSIVITLGLSYLLFQRKEDIRALFSRYKTTLPPVGNNKLRVAARISCILIPCLFIIYYRYDTLKSKKYFGKWKVETMTRNGETVPERAWEKDTSAWKTIYFEERGGMLYCPNPYMYDNNTSLYMAYKYDDKENSLKVISYEHNPEKPDTIPVQINKYNGNSMQWNMIFNKDTIQMQLKKVSK